MTCVKCKKVIPDDAVYCLYCGKKQLSTQAPKPLKRANGTGSVWKLSGRRKKPWVAATTLGTRPDGRINRIILGCFATKTEALECLAATIQNGIPESYNYTLQTTYDDWKKVHYPTISEKGKEGYVSAWQHLQELKDMKMRDVKTQHLQGIINKLVDAGKSRATCEKVRNLASQLCQKAMENDLINKNYASFLVLPKSDAKEKDRFSDDEIARLRDIADGKKIGFKDDKPDEDKDIQPDPNEIRTAKIIYTLIYTGLRIDELFSLTPVSVYLSGDKNYFVGGSKTEAGKDRTVPINKKILGYITEWKNASGSFLITRPEGGRYEQANFRKRDYYPLLEKYKIQRLNPHCTRHTFASLMVEAGVNSQALKEIFGHEKYETISDLYAHTDYEQLEKAITAI